MRETVTPATMGPYRIVRRLGRGGMGEVYLGVHRETGGEAAVKVLATGASPEMAPAVRARVAREVRTLQRVHHPNVVELAEADEAGPSGTIRWYAMEYLPWSSLEEVLAAEGPLPVERALAHARGLLAALACLHAQGIVHRDLKPGNVMVSPAGDRVVLVDFGLVLLAEATSITATGALVGTPRYLAPELWCHQKASPATDLFAFGLVLYELLVGRPFNRGKDLLEVATQSQTFEPPQLLALRPDAPPGLGAVLARCLARDPARRYGSAGEAVAALEAVRASVAPAPAPSAAGPRGRPRALFPAAAVGLLFGAAAVALWPRPSLPPLSGLSVEPGVRSLLVRCTMARPCAPTLALAGSDGRVRWTSAAAGRPSAEQAFLVPRAAWVAGGLGLLRAAGASAATTFALPSTPPYALAGPDTVATSAGARLAWRCSLPLEGRLAAGGRELARARGPDLTFDVPAGEFALGGAALTLTLRDHLGDEVSAPAVALASLPLDPFAVEARALAAPENLARYAELVDAPAAPGPAAVRQEVLGRRNLELAARLVAPRAAALLSSPRLPFERRLALFGDLGRLRRVDAMLAALGERRPFGWEPRGNGFVDVGLLGGEPFGHGGAWPGGVAHLVQPDDEDSCMPERPRWARDRGLEFIVASAGAQAQRTASLAVDEAFLAGCAGGRAVLHLGVRVTLPGVMVEVTLNRQLPLQLWLPCAIQSETARLHFVVELPARLLRVGQNELVVRWVALADRFAFDHGAFREASLLPGPLAAWLPRFAGPAQRLVEVPPKARPLRGP